MKNLSFLLIGVMLLLNSHLKAQETSLFSDLTETEISFMETISAYPEAERMVILDASLQPALLVRIQGIRKQTETDFADKLSGLSQKDQEALYNVSRFPDLVENLALKGNEVRAGELETILRPFPPEVQKDARDIVKMHPVILEEIHALYQVANTKFENLISKYDEDTRLAYTALLQMPEVLTLLAEDLSFTLLLGDMYTFSRDQLLEELDSLSLEVAEHETEALLAWKEQLERDPEAMEEFVEASDEFAGDYGYDDEVYSGPVPESYREDIYIHHVWQAYPYWFGWPSWYPDPCWYPYPWWYHRGYYRDAGGIIVVFRLPSWHFFSWHFRYDRHFYSYPHFTNRVFDHYYGPRGSHGGIRTAVNRWERNHRSDLPDGWFVNDGQRVERIREYGKFQMDYRKTVEASTGKVPSQREYLRDNADKYPSLKPVLNRPEPERQPKVTRPGVVPKTQDKPGPVKVKPETVPQRDPVRKQVPTQDKEKTVDKPSKERSSVWDIFKRQPGKTEKPADRTKVDKQDNPKQKTVPSRKVPPQPKKVEPKKSERGGG